MAGLHVGWPTACVTLMSPKLPVSNPNMHDRYMLLLPLIFDP
jgi:hypothetical protein